MLPVAKTETSVNGINISNEDDNPYVDIVFIVNGTFKRYNIQSHISSDNRSVFLVDDILTESEMLKDFKSCSSVKIRINESHCVNDYYEFRMDGSSSAINFMSKSDMIDRYNKPD